MSCTETEPELVAYHFGTLDDGTRARVEDHLVGCASCVRAFVELKRAIEFEPLDAGAVPSKSARARLRRAVANELGIDTPRRWWERPIAFALAASVVLAAGAATRVITSGPGSPPNGLSAGSGK